MPLRGKSFTIEDLRPANLKARLRKTVVELRARADREYEMSFNRLMFILAVALYLACTRQPGYENGLTYLGYYFAFSVVTLTSVIRNGKRNDFRRVLALIADFISIAYEMHAGDGMTSALIAIYLWVIFGNGFRFGVKFLAISTVAANTTFLLMAATTKFWQEHTPLTVGCFLGMVVLPLYVSKLIRKLSTASEQAQQANKSKTMFLASVSHELRTPLHTITNAAVLLEGTPLDGEQRELTVTLRNSARYLNTLIGEILDLSRMEANGSQLELAPNNIAELLMEAQSMIRLPAAEKGLDLRLQVSPRLPAAGMLDRRLVLQVVMNLMSNALKFTETGHVTLAVLPGQEPGTIQFEVTDTGIGIAKEALGKIFDTFVQADHTIIDRFGGTGLGLSIAKHLVETMGGGIDVESTPGQGSRFCVRLPMAKVDTPVSEGSAEPGTVVIVGRPGDDTLREHLSAIGMTAENADTVEHGVELVRSARQAGKTAYIAATAEGIEGEGAAATTPALLRDMGAMLLTSASNAEADRGDRNCLPTYISTSSTPEELRAAFRVVSTLAGTPTSTTAPLRSARSRRLHVLVADDNLVNRKIMAKILTNRGHRATLVANGEDALDVLEHETFDLILMDVNMPVLNGIEATKMFRFLEPHAQRTPVLALTADATQEMAQRCTEAGMDGVVTKPVEPDRIMGVIESFTSLKEDIAPAAADLPPVELAFDVVLPVLDKQTQEGLRKLGGDEFAHEVSVQFLSDALPLLATLKAAGEARDVEQFRFDAHAIRSSARNIGAKSVAAFAELAETLSEASFDRDASRLVARIEIELKRLQRELENTVLPHRVEGPVAGH